jgi:streptogramin lyase
MNAPYLWSSVFWFRAIDVMTAAALLGASFSMPLAMAQAPKAAQVVNAGPPAVGAFLQEVPLHHEVGHPALGAMESGSLWLDPQGALHARGEGGYWTGSGGKWSRNEQPWPQAAKLEAMVFDPIGSGRAAKIDPSLGLVERQREDAPWEVIEAIDNLGLDWARRSLGVAVYDRSGHLWIGSRAGIAHRQDGQWTFASGHQGVPWNEFLCAAAAPDGSVWFGTTRGAIVARENDFAYRQGLRWIPGDRVEQIVIDGGGTVHLATDQGLGSIAMRPMDLLDKADYYQDEIDRLIQRTEFGYIATAHLIKPGDRSQVEVGDDDNDGLWTAMYGASQCFAYGWSGKQEHRQRADRVMKALAFLQEVTEGGSPAPPPGYVARTVLPFEGRDPNEGQEQRDRQVQQRDPLWKSLQPRWPRSADGKWYWKGDTSSDELDGHYFFYGLYYDLVADTPERKDQVRTVVRGLTDHLIDHHFTLVDHDGKPTRWANFDPRSLNQDFSWMVERGLNSASMLSYLAVAAHVLEDDRYRQVAMRLSTEHAYAMNAMVPKVQRGIGSGNQSDDEMGFMSFYSLVKYTEDPSLRTAYLAAFHQYWMLEQPERNPFFHFAYAAVAKEFADGDRSLPLMPWGQWREDSIDTLVRFPLDRCEWRHTNSHRLDLVRLPPQQSIDWDQPNDGTRGYRVDGKVLPVDERNVTHWNTDPWRFDQGGNGHQLGSGTVYLLPLYLGLYHRLIALEDTKPDGKQ